MLLKDQNLAVQITDHQRRGEVPNPRISLELFERRTSRRDSEPAECGGNSVSAVLRLGTSLLLVSCDRFYPSSALIFSFLSLGRVFHEEIMFCCITCGLSMCRHAPSHLLSRIPFQKNRKKKQKRNETENETAVRWVICLMRPSPIRFSIARFASQRAARFSIFRFTAFFKQAEVCVNRLTFSVFRFTAFLKQAEVCVNRLTYRNNAAVRPLGARPSCTSHSCGG